MYMQRAPSLPAWVARNSNTISFPRPNSFLYDFRSIYLCVVACFDSETHKRNHQLLQRRRRQQQRKTFVLQPGRLPRLPIAFAQMFKWRKNEQWWRRNRFYRSAPKCLTCSTWFPRWWTEKGTENVKKRLTARPMKCAEGTQRGKRPQKVLS